MSKKNSITAVAISKDASIVSVLMPSPDMDRSGRINYFYRVAEEAGKLSVRAMFYVGLELMKTKAELKHGDFGKWIDSNCSFSSKTAQNYIHAAYMYLSKKFDVDHLLETTDAERQEAIDETACDCGDATVRDLYLELGICKKSPSRMGGRREGAGRKRKEDLAAQAEAQAAELGAESIKQRVSDLYTAAVIQGGLGNCTDDQLNDVVKTLKMICREGEEILKSRKAK